MKNTILLLLLSVTTTFAQLINTQVKLDDGIIEGNLEESGVFSFKKIPYAAPPVDNFRWKAPQPVQSWTGVKSCKTFGSSPIQVESNPVYMWSEEFLIPKEPTSEDCLFLNVWTNAKTQKDKKPVIVWIHGGGFTAGSGSVPIYDGGALAKKGVVFVNFNYRLGVFGFFAHPELSKEVTNHSSGNYGMLDMIAALKWVKKNIHAFGGDPENITIAGQSAGSVAVVYLVASPLAKGLFNKAIAQSGAGLLSRQSTLTFDGLPNLKESETEGVKIANQLNASNVEELRKISGEELLKKVRFRTHPIVDGYVLPENVAEIFKKNQENNVSLLTGWNEDEGIVMWKPKNAIEFKNDLENKFGSLAEGFLQHYPATTDEQTVISEQKFQRDLVFGAQNYSLANIMCNHKKQVYVYRFTRIVPANGEYKKFGAFHTGEVPYALNTLNFVNRPFEQVDYKLAETMSLYWVNFAHSGNPNKKGMPTWPMYNVNLKQIMEFGIQARTKNIPDAPSLDYFYEKLFLRN